MMLLQQGANKIMEMTHKFRDQEIGETTVAKLLNQDSLEGTHLLNLVLEQLKKISPEGSVLVHLRMEVCFTVPLAVLPEGAKSTVEKPEFIIEPLTKAKWEKLDQLVLEASRRRLDSWKNFLQEPDKDAYGSEVGWKRWLDKLRLGQVLMYPASKVKQLSAWVGTNLKGTACCATLWKMTHEEMDKFIKTGKLWLIVLGTNHPVVELTVEDPFVQRKQEPEVGS